MSKTTEDLRLLIGDKGKEYELPAYLESPTWIVNKVWDRWQEVARNALNAYMSFCERNKLPHSYLLGLDILVMGEVDKDDPYKIIDIRPTMVEGPCCNSYPACPNLWAYRLYKRLKLSGVDPDVIEYPTHPTKILDTLISTFQAIWEDRGNKGMPRIGVFTRPYEYSEEETAHNVTLNAFIKAGYEAYRITPAEEPVVKDGRIWVHGVPIDMCYRRIERVHVKGFYGEKLGEQIINETPNTIWINPWKIDDLRSKTLEERCFREWEEISDEIISRPKTLLGDEIKSHTVAELANRGGFALKKWNSSGGKGVFLHLVKSVAKKAADYLYLKYDGRHMILLDDKELQEELKRFDDFKEDTSIQQLRLTDARVLDEERRLVYDSRINVLYNPLKKEWQFLSGISRVVACGPKVKNGNSLLTNISSGAEIAPLIMGYSKKEELPDYIKLGPLMEALYNGYNEVRIK